MQCYSSSSAAAVREEESAESSSRIQHQQQHANNSSNTTPMTQQQQNRIPGQWWRCSNGMCIPTASKAACNVSNTDCITTTSSSCNRSHSTTMHHHTAPSISLRTIHSRVPPGRRARTPPLGDPKSPWSNCWPTQVTHPQPEIHSYQQHHQQRAV